MNIGRPAPDPINTASNPSFSISSSTVVDLPMEIEILQREDVTAPDKTIVDIRIDKKEKVKIHSITIEGNHALSTKKIKGTMFVPCFQENQ